MTGRAGGRAAPGRSLVRALAVVMGLAPPLMLPAAAPAVTVVAVVDCGAWVQARRSGQSREVETYAVGALNGMSVARNEEFWQAGPMAMNVERVFQWLDARCRTHALEPFDLSLGTLFDQHTRQ